jgi:hypothetical protein
VVTQAIVTLGPEKDEFNLCSVAEKVKKQLGFPVILLDSKLGPLIENESTSAAGFWKSTWKFIAASRPAYKKAGGVLPDTELCLDDCDRQPQPKRTKTVESEGTQDLFSCCGWNNSRD